MEWISVWRLCESSFCLQMCGIVLLMDLVPEEYFVGVHNYIVCLMIRKFWAFYVLKHELCVAVSVCLAVTIIIDELVLCTKRTPWRNKCRTLRVFVFCIFCSDWLNAKSCCGGASLNFQRHVMFKDQGTLIGYLIGWILATFRCLRFPNRPHNWLSVLVW